MNYYTTEDDEDIVPNPDTAIEYQERDIGGNDGEQELDWTNQFFTRNVFHQAFHIQNASQEFKKVSVV